MFSIKLKIYLLWIFSLWLVYVLISVGCKSTRRPPAYIDPYETIYLNCFMLAHVKSLTLEIAKDVQMKLNQANSIQEKYKYTLAYELGTLAAGIQETFEHMLEIYRTYSNLDDFKNRTYNLSVTMNAYHVIQGDYNKIRLEKELFRKVKDKFEAKRQADLKLYQSMGLDTDRLPKGTPNPKDLGDLKAFSDLHGGGIKPMRRNAIGPQGVPWKITTTTTKRRLWKSASVDYINIT